MGAELLEVVEPVEPGAVVAALEALLVSSDPLPGHVPETTYVVAPGATQGPQESPPLPSSVRYGTI